MHQVRQVREEEAVRKKVKVKVFYVPPTYSTYIHNTSSTQLWSFYINYEFHTLLDVVLGCLWWCWWFEETEEIGPTLSY